MSEPTLQVTVTVNGEQVTRTVRVRQHLVDFLHMELGLTGSHLGCEHGVCGACAVRVDGRVVRGCLMLAVQTDGAQVTTIEGLTDTGEIADLQARFVQRNALQCGFCTSGWLFTRRDYYRDPSMIPNVRMLQANIDLLRDSGFLNEPIDITSYIDLGLIQEASRRL